jgi:hypothetical protein
VDPDFWNNRGSTAIRNNRRSTAIRNNRGILRFHFAPDSTLSVVNTLFKIYFLLNGTTATGTKATGTTATGTTATGTTATLYALLPQAGVHKFQGPKLCMMPPNISRSTVRNFLQVNFLASRI